MSGTAEPVEAPVLAAFTMSLDGFVAGPGVSPALPMGAHGLRLHEWVFNTDASPIDAELLAEAFATTGAVILGRRTFDVGHGVWNDTPFPVPCFVLTHRPRPPLPQSSGTFTFVGDGIASALRQARAAAGGRFVRLMGAEVARQYLHAGLVDALHIQVAPLLLGGGSRLFEPDGNPPVTLERTAAIETPLVTHLHFRVVKETP